MRYNHYTWCGRNALSYCKTGSCGISITSGLEEIPNLIQENELCGKNITPGVEEKAYLIQESPSCGITVTPGVEEMPYNILKSNHAV